MTMWRALLAIAAAAESVATAGATAAGGLGRDFAELGERGLVLNAVGVVADGHQDLAGDLHANALECASSRAAAVTKA
jgi:hypothetical protein